MSARRGNRGQVEWSTCRLVMCICFSKFVIRISYIGNLLLGFPYGQYTKFSQICLLIVLKVGQIKEKQAKNITEWEKTKDMTLHL